MYAIIRTGGKQYKVEAGDTLYIEKLDVKLTAKLFLTRLSQSVRKMALL